MNEKNKFDMDAICQGCKEQADDGFNSGELKYHYWARNDYNGFFTGVYCDECYDDAEKYPYRKDNYNQDAMENGEDIWGEE